MKNIKELGTIKVVNFKNYVASANEVLVMIDRSSTFGNPFPMNVEADRDIVCDKYISYINEAMNWNSANYNLKFRNDFKKLILDPFMKGANIALGCHCAPARCHGDSIVDKVAECVYQIATEEMIISETDTTNYVQYLTKLVGRKIFSYSFEYTNGVISAPTELIDELINNNEEETEMNNEKSKVILIEGATYLDIQEKAISYQEVKEQLIKEQTNEAVYYAGIGSRETPDKCLSVFEFLGEILAQNGVTLRSGGAKGADSAFEKGCDKTNGKAEIFLASNGFNGHYLNKVTNPNKYMTTKLTQEAFDLAEQFHPNWKACSDYAKKLMARNGYQVLGESLNSKTDFIVCYCVKDRKGNYKGGTSQALRIAMAYGIKIFNAYEYSSMSQFIKDVLEYANVQYEMPTALIESLDKADIAMSVQESIKIADSVTEELVQTDNTTYYNSDDDLFAALNGAYGNDSKPKTIPVVSKEENKQEDITINAPNILECSSKGDKRFSAFYAKVDVFGVTDSIENHYQGIKRDKDGNKVGKGIAPDHLVINVKTSIDTHKDVTLDKKYLTAFYKMLWVKYLDKNPELVEFASKYDDFNDMFKGKNTLNCQADVIREYIKNGRASIVQAQDFKELNVLLREAIKSETQEQVASTTETNNEFDPMSFIKNQRQNNYTPSTTSGKTNEEIQQEYERAYNHKVYDGCIGEYSYLPPTAKQIKEVERLVRNYDVRLQVYTTRSQVSQLIKQVYTMVHNCTVNVRANKNGEVVIVEEDGVKYHEFKEAEIQTPAQTQTNNNTSSLANIFNYLNR